MKSSRWTNIFLTTVVFFSAMCHGLIDLPEPLPGTNTYQIRMPGVVPQMDDDYICTAIRLSPESKYITRFRVEGTAERAHHMILNGCGSVPQIAMESLSWNCGHHGTCASDPSVLYAWAKNAEGTQLPPSVGFRIGNNDQSRVKYLVIQVHYATKLPPGERDYTGLDLEITSDPQKYIAGILLMVAIPEIPPLRAVVNSDSCCPVTVPAPIHVFAARVHAHALGRVITGYKFNPKTEVVEQMTKGNPQWPQAFYPTPREFVLDNGDEILIRCTYSSLDKTTPTYAGGTGADEMCNVYLMYYTDARNGSSYQSCGYLCNEQQNRAYPADSIEPLPRNPILEAYAIHRGHSNVTNSEQSSVNQSKSVTVDVETGRTQLAEDPMDLNRVYYKQVFNDAHHHHQPQKDDENEEKAVGQADVQQPETRQSVEPKEDPTVEKKEKLYAINEEDFWPIFFFYRRFLS